MKVFCHAANLREKECDVKTASLQLKESLDYAKEMGIPRVDFVGEKIETLTR
ncbi:MAG: hypothetical protein ACLTE2_03725 [Eubacteriales bacterium]